MFLSHELRLTSHNLRFVNKGQKSGEKNCNLQLTSCKFNARVAKKFHVQFDKIIQKIKQIFHLKFKKNICTFEANYKHYQKFIKLSLWGLFLANERTTI